MWFIEWSLYRIIYKIADNRIYKIADNRIYKIAEWLNDRIILYKIIS